MHRTSIMIHIFGKYAQSKFLPIILDILVANTQRQGEKYIAGYSNDNFAPCLAQKIRNSLQNQVELCCLIGPSQPRTF